jgi:formylglycine-generating enzyme required for sulfatase activity/predicted ATPase
MRHGGQILKTFKIFLASSNEHKDERDQINLMITKENKQLEKQSIRFEVIRWEDMLKSFQKESFQDSINEQLFLCDIFIVLFSSRVGDFTLQEFELAHERLKQNQKPHYLFVFFKEIVMDDSIDIDDYMKVMQIKKTIKKYQQIYQTYSTIDSLKLKINEQLNLIISCFQEDCLPPPIQEPVKPVITSQSLEKLKEDYFVRTFNDVGILNLSGLDPNASGERAQKINLSAIYTALLTYSTNREMDFSEKHIEQYDKFSALEMLNKHKHLVLLGDPGSGKTTFVNFVTLCLAGEALKKSRVNLKLLTQPLPETENPQAWDHKTLMPVRIILRDFVARGLPKSKERATANHLWQFIASELRNNYLEDYAPYLKQELKSNGGLILFDGLDEVPEADARRTQIKQVVEDVMVNFHRCRILVTGRTYAYQKQDYKISGLTEAILAPFSSAQVTMFIERWYGHIAEIRNMNRDDAKGRAVLLKRAINNSNRLQELAGRPLLLTLMASLHAWRGGSLPEQREELYSNAVDLLLDWWERPRIVRDDQGEIIVLQPSLMEWLKVDRKKIRGLLNQLAYNAHKNQPDLAGTADVAEKDLVDGMLNISNLDINPGKLVEYLRDRAGILLSRGIKVYTFPHRTFQEYLAACHLTDTDFPEHVSKLVKKDLNRWREATLLAAAKAVRGSESSVWILAEELCYKDTASCEPTIENINGAYLAAQALIENAGLEKISDRNKDKLYRIKDWLILIIQGTQLPALERTNAGNLLAKLGDPRKEIITIKSMQFCFVPEGEFVMGSDEYDNEVQHTVYLSSYYMSRYPVTHAQYHCFVKDGGYANPAYWQEAIEAGKWKEGKYDGHDQAGLNGDPFDLLNHPVVSISWYEASAFTRWLTNKFHAQNILPESAIIRLPTEAEWEKASRGGLKIPEQACLKSIQAIDFNPQKNLLVDNENTIRVYPWGDKFDKDKCNAHDTGINATSAVGCFTSGQSVYGCEEMSGNVWEWCMDWYGDYSESLVTNPVGPTSGSSRVLRGGSWDDSARYCRSASRNGNAPPYRYWNFGFRLVVSQASGEKAR